MLKVKRLIGTTIINLEKQFSKEQKELKFMLYPELINAFKDCKLFFRSNYIVDMNNGCANLFDFGGFTSSDAMLDEIILSGEVRIRAKQMNDGYKNNPVKYEVGGFKNEE